MTLAMALIVSGMALGVLCTLIAEALPDARLRGQGQG